jgi:tetraacyldisaccharide 4'-kinase
VSTGESYPAGYFADKRVLAYCGIGNPASFSDTLRLLAVRPVAFLTVSDHQPYGAGLYRAITRVIENNGIEAILTTEKDAVKLPASSAFSVPVYYLRIYLAVSPESEFRDAVMNAITPGTRHSAGD